MTTSHHIVVATRRTSALLELALGVFLVLLVAALWLALFSIVPLDFRPPRVS